MKATRVIVLAVFCVLIAGFAGAQTEWTHYPDNPVIGFDEVGEWAPGGARVSSLVFDGSTYHMWFTGLTETQFVTGIGHATSIDGLDWTMDPANPVLTEGADGEWDELYVICGEVIRDGGQFHMWYAGISDTDLREFIGYATSPDGSAWTKYAGNPVMEPGPAGSWDDTDIGARAVVFDGGIFKMWYDGGQGDHVYRVGYAESTDGIEWTKRPDPVLEPGSYAGAWANSFWNPTVVYDGATYHMWFVGELNGAERVGYAFSSDGISWFEYRENPVLVDAEGEAVFEFRVVRDGDIWKSWFTHVLLGTSEADVSYATSDCCTAMGWPQFIPAAAVASGAQGSFFTTDVDLSNRGSQPVEYQLMWLPRGANNSEPMTSETFTLGADMSVRYANVLAEVFDLQPNSLGALMLMSTFPDLLAMSRTYNTPSGDPAGTYGQAMPAVAPGEMMATGERKRILFASDNAEMRTNIGCQSASDGTTVVNVELFDSEGMSLERTMAVLSAFGNDQLNRPFEDYAPVDGYVEVWTDVPNRRIYCYGSVLDNTTSDPTTIPPQ